jgi:hypothetical protein
MAIRTEIESALAELISNEEGMKFQGLAVVLAKLKWPQLIARERKKDLGLDAFGVGLPFTGRVRGRSEFDDPCDRSHHAVFQASSTGSSGIISKGSGCRNKGEVRRNVHSTIKCAHSCVSPEGFTPRACAKFVLKVVRIHENL